MASNSSSPFQNVFNYFFHPYNQASDTILRQEISRAKKLLLTKCNGLILYTEEKQGRQPH